MGTVSGSSKLIKPREGMVGTSDLYQWKDRNYKKELNDNFRVEIEIKILLERFNNRFELTEEKNGKFVDC